jgi:hypothetical protein
MAAGEQGDLRVGDAGQVDDVCRAGGAHPAHVERGDARVVGEHGSRGCNQLRALGLGPAARRVGDEREHEGAAQREDEAWNGEREARVFGQVRCGECGCGQRGYGQAIQGHPVAAAQDQRCAMREQGGEQHPSSARQAQKLARSRE